MSDRHLFWINHFARPPGVSGGSRHYEMGRDLVRRGWRVTLLTTDFSTHSREYFRRTGSDDRRVIHEEIDGVAFRHFWSAPYETNDWHRAWNWISFARSLTRWEPDRGRPDVIIGSSPHLLAAWAGLRMARRWKVPFLFEVRDLWPESMIAAGGRRGPAYYAFRWIANHLYREADRVVCLARGTRAYLRDQLGVPEGKLVFVPNGVDPGSFAEIERPTRPTTTFVYAGAHGPANGLDTVLEAAYLLREREDLRFLFVGDGPAKPGLERQAEELRLENVTFLDPVPKARIPELFAAADAGLMVLRETPLFAFGVSPNKLFDYMGAALPVVCNVPGEVETMVREAGAGEQAADGSAEALAAAVTRLAARSAGERAAMGRAARDWVSLEHGRTILARRLDDVLRELVP